MKKEEYKSISYFGKTARRLGAALNSLIAFATFVAIAKAQGSGVSLPTGTGLSERPLPDILKGLVSWLLLIFGYVAIISFVVTGIMYLMGGSMTGEKKDVSGAKKQLQWSITGVIVGLSGYIILKAVDTWLKGSSTF